MKKQKKLAGLEKRKSISGYIFIAPFILGFLLFMFKPLIDSLVMSFQNVELNGTIGSTRTFIGFENYRNALRVDPDFNRLLTEEFIRLVVYTLAIIVFSFFISLVLNQKFKGRSLVRAVFFLPVILSSGVILGLESNNQYMAAMKDTVETTVSGISVSAAVESILKTMDVGGAVFDKVFEVIDNIYDVAMASGMQIIIFLSGLQTISSSMYEAASIDGCTKWESLWKITFPMISSLFLVNWIYTIVDFCMRSDNQVIDKITTVMTSKLQYGPASAMSWLYFLFIIAFVGITSFFISKVVYYND
ncbi:MAG: sugar ABC transporter permease [Lachnospiraceae bacterium]|nr:sugar ABC transporter permease [Lachnospiraceae bacterium]